jgi:iron uptake system component EfeO
MIRYRTLSLFACGVLASGCSSSSTGPTKTDTQYQADVVGGMHQKLLTDLAALASAAKDLQNAAPLKSGQGWDGTADVASLSAMKDAWSSARSAYERVEGAIAPLFPDVDSAIDARYDDFLVTLGPSGDTDLFDDVGVTGMHGVERILYSTLTPARVIDFEATLPGYVAAAFPATEAQSSEFKNKLCQKLASDTQGLHDAWQAANNFDLGAAFGGLISLMNEQREKVDKASTNEEESRYAQHTMQDIRDNLAGTRAIYALFQPWLRSKSRSSFPDAGDNGISVDTSIVAGFDSLDRLYSSVLGDAVPETPADFSSENPTPANLATPFGQLYVGVRDAVDANRPSSVVFEMNAAAVILGFPQFVEEP